MKITYQIYQTNNYKKFVDEIYWLAKEIGYEVENLGAGIYIVFKIL